MGLHRGQSLKSISFCLHDVEKIHILRNYLKLGSGIAKSGSPPARDGRDKFKDEPPKISGSRSRNSKIWQKLFL